MIDARCFCSLLVVGWRSSSPFRIHVVDEATRRGVPLVELEALTNQSAITDSNGLVAITDPVLMNRTAFFYVRSHGYEFKKDGFGFAGTRLDVKPGGRAELRIKRKNIAERLYRMTGGGIYRHTVALGEKPPIKEPLLNAQVLGSDSVQMTTYKGKLHWFWGDTQRVSYPLGNFNTPGATSLLPTNGGLDPDVGVDLEYFVAKDGFAKGAAPMPGPGPTWTTGLMVLRDASGKEQMFAGYAKIKNMLDVYERGLMVWDDAANEFRKVVAFPKDVRAHPTGTHIPAVDRRTATTSTSATPPHWCESRPTRNRCADPSAYEVFGCTDPQSDAKNPTIERDSAGRPKYSWRSGRAFGGADGDGKLVKSGMLKPDEVALPLRDPDTGKRMTPHAGSTVWNPYRRKWIMVLTEIYGTSMLGEIWYAEADSPVGPWVYAQEDSDPRQIQLLQPQAASRLLQRQRPRRLLRGNLHDDVLRQHESDAGLRVQPDHAPHESRRSAAQPCRRRSTRSRTRPRGSSRATDSGRIRKGRRRFVRSIARRRNATGPRLYRKENWRSALRRRSSPLSPSSMRCLRRRRIGRRQRRGAS